MRVTLILQHVSLLTLEGMLMSPLAVPTAVETASATLAQCPDGARETSQPQISVDGLPLPRQDCLWPVKTSLKILWFMATAAAPAAVTPLLWCCYVRATSAAVPFYCCCCSCNVCDMFLLLTPVSMVIVQISPSR